MPKVSVVILTYNRATMLKQAIQSVLDQTFQDFELLVVDDCSTDDTTKTVKSLSDNRIKYIRHEKNKGESAGRNTGIRNAAGEYIGYLDDDDEWLPEKLRLQVECLDQSLPEVGAVYSGRMDFNVKTGEVLRTIVHQEKGHLFSRLLKGNFLTLSGVLVRAKCFEQIGEFDCGIKFGPDYDMWLRLSQVYQFECVSQPLVKYGIHDKALSNNLDAQIHGRETWLRKYGQFLSSDPQEYNRRFSGLGYLYILNGDMAKGRENLLKAIRKNPRVLRAYLIFCMSFLGKCGVRKVDEILKKKKD